MRPIVLVSVVCGLLRQLPLLVCHPDCLASDISLHNNRWLCSWPDWAGHSASWHIAAGSNQLKLAEHTQRKQCDMMTFSLRCVTSLHLLRSNVSPSRSHEWFPSPPHPFYTFTTLFCCCLCQLPADNNTSMRETSWLPCHHVYFICLLTLGRFFHVRTNNIWEERKLILIISILKSLNTDWSGWDQVCCS